MIIREQGKSLSLSLFKMTFTVTVSDKLTSNVWKWSLKASFWVRLCYSHFLFFVSWCFDIWALAVIRHCSSQDQQFLRQQEALKCALQIKNHPSRVPTPTTSLLERPHSGPPSTCPHHPRARCQTTWDSLFVPSPMKLVDLVDPKSGCSAWTLSFQGNQNKDSCCLIP